MTVVVKHRIRGDGRIWVDQNRTKVLRAAGGWYAVLAPTASDNARVLFRPVQDIVVIEQSGRFLRVPFHAGEGRFEYDGRAYLIGVMTLGMLRIVQEGRLVARGVVTVSGVRFDLVATELLPIIRPLAWALTLRSEEIVRDVWRAPNVPSAG